MVFMLNGVNTMQRDTIYDHDTYFTVQATIPGQVGVWRQPAGCATAKLVTTLPLAEAIKACNALRREARAPLDLPDRVLPSVPRNVLLAH